jgi:long-chain acyl-CoA synthetase
MGAEYEAALGGEEPVDPALPTGPDSVLFQLYSSGTTGLPKGTLITNANMEFTQQSGRRLYGMDQHSVNLVVSPQFHIGGAGYGMTALSQGGHTVLLTDADPARILRAIEEHRVTHAFLVPAIVQSLLAAPDLANTDLSSLQLVAYGGAPMGEALLLRAIKGLGCRFLGVYGMTETAGTVIALAAEDHDPGGPRADLLRSIGKPLPWMGEAQVRDPMTGAEVGPGEVGEIWVRSGQVTPGYWQQPETTEQALTSDGWLRTGDAAYRDDDGYFFLHDRMKDMIITGGENVYPAEVENVIAHHPAVLEVAVIGVPSERWGETVKALVVVDAASEATERELIDFARERLAHYKCPTSVDFVNSLPRNASGKLLKKVLREPYWPQQGRAVR